MPRKTLVSPRKSPKQGRSKNLVGTILTATTRVLETAGYAKATTNRIAELAGVSIGSLYQYFPSKEALVGAILDQQIERNQKRFEAKILEVDGKSLEELIDVLVQTAAETYLPNRKIMSILFEQAPALQKTQNILRVRKHVTSQLKQVLDRFEGKVRPKNTELAVFIAVNAVLGVLQMALLSYPDGIKEAELTREMSHMVRRYFI